MISFFRISVFLLVYKCAFAQIPTVVPLEIQAQFNGQFDYKVIGNTLNEFDNNNTPPPPCQMLTQSSASLNIDPNQNVVAAYLYWSGIGDGTFNPIVELNGIEIQADQTEIVSPFQSNFALYYSSFKDITNIVQTYGNGLYIFSNLDLNPIIGAYCTSGVYHGGWSILVIYEDNTLPTQQVNIYNGLASVYGNLNSPFFEASISITNLNVVDTQNARLGYLAWNGSPNQFFNENLTFNGSVLSNALNPPDNPFNGTNTYTGATDLWNMDLDVFDISNFVSLGDSQASLTFTSGFNRFIQNVVTVIRSELPDAQVELLNFNGVSDCDERDFTIETVVSNPESSDILPANTPISFFVLDANGDEVFLDTFFTQNPIPIDGSETQFLDISIPDNIPNDTTLIVKVNTIADGSNPVNENNILNNTFEQELNLLSSPNPIVFQSLSQCANLNDAIFNLDNALTSNPNSGEILNYFLTGNDAVNNTNPIPNPNSYNPNNAFEIIYIRLSNSDCYINSAFTVETLIPPQINEPTVFAECDTTQNQSGFTAFDLESKIPEITNNNPDYEVQFFLTQTEAEDLTISDGISSPYTNETAFSQILFVRVTDLNNGCVSFTELELQVDLLPVIAEPSNIPTIAACDEDENGQEIFDLIANNPAILNGLNPTEHQIEFYISQTDAENDVNEIYNPTAFPSSGQTIYVRVTNDETGCFSITTFDVNVNPIPPLQSVPSNAVCDTNNDGMAEFFLPQALNDIIDDTSGFSFQYFETLTDAQNNTNPIANPDNYQNTQTPIQTIYVLATDDETGCQNIQSIQIEVLENPSITEPAILAQCDLSEEQNGFDTFDLNAVIPEITGGNPNYDVNFFLTQAEAEDLTITTGLTSPFINTIAFSQILFVRVTDSNNGCVSFTTLDLEVNPLPAIAEAPNIPDLELCDDNENGQAIFDLTQNNAAILNGLDPNAYQIQFYTSQTDAENDTNEINTSTTFSSVGQTVFVRVTETATSCFAITTFNLVVNPVPQLQAVPTQTICDENADGFEVFDLSLAENSILPDTTGFNFQYFESLSDAQNEVNSISNPETYTNTQSPIQTVFVLVTDDLTGCENIQPFDIEVLEIPQITDPTPLSECDTTSDQSGFASFDLASKIPEITNNNPEYEVSFFLTQAEAEDLTITTGLTSPFINTIAFSQILFVRVTDNVNGCVSITTLELEIEAGADLFDETQLQNLRVCNEDDLAFFDLTQVESSIFDADNSNEFSINYFTSEGDAIDNTNPIAQPDNFQNTEIPQNIWIRVSAGGNCFEVASFQLDIDFLPVASSPENLFLCDEGNDLVESFDLSQQNESILNDLPATDNSISYHETLADAESNSSPIDVNYTNENNPQTIYARLENNSATECFSITSFDIEVLETPVINIEDELVLCQDEPLVISIDNSYDEYLWSNGETSSTITVTEPGNYQVTALINHSELSCETSKSFEVILSEEAIINDITTVDWTQSNNSISILVEGNGDYEYSIDGINYQDSNVFNNLTEYEYLVHIRDKNGCGETLRRVYLLDYPQFFTPNGDGINDRWQIINSKQEIFTKIYIFDRYGKLVAEINPVSSGWDGTLNGNALPSNDYWFRVEREDGRVLTGHFTLKR